MAGQNTQTQNTRDYNNHNGQVFYSLKALQISAFRNIANQRRNISFLWRKSAKLKTLY